jgi:hypothetical protein
MWKRCPHCRDYAFDERELIWLAYANERACKNCGRAVRNDGPRSVLILPAMVAGAVAGVFLLYLLPSWLAPVALVMLIALVLLPLVLIPKPVKVEQGEVSLPPFAPDPRNDKVITVSGWNDTELTAILEGFAAHLPPFPIEILCEDEDCYRVTFPADLHPSEFTALVNYLHHPSEIGISDHIIRAAGIATLDTNFEDIPESLVGEKAIFYVPDNDQDHDVVYLQTESGANLVNSLQDIGWRSIKQARLGNETKQLVGWSDGLDHFPPDGLA